MSETGRAAVFTGAGQPFEITPEDEGTFSHTQDMGWGGKNLR